MTDNSIKDAEQVAADLPKDLRAVLRVWTGEEFGTDPDYPNNFAAESIALGKLSGAGLFVINDYVDEELGPCRSMSVSELGRAVAAFLAKDTP